MLAAFLTAYDPSDLPGGSLDPLGFDRGYTLLADKILPGLTNVASKPRYFSVLCAGAVLADRASGAIPGETARDRRQRRIDIVLRLERYWALANVLGTERAPELAAGGIRGIRYVQAAVRRLKDKAAKDSNADYRLLAQQQRYGVVGIYSAVSESLRLLDRSTFALSADLGAALGEAFLEHTGASDVLLRQVVDGKPVALGALAEWGTAAHVTASVGPGEARCFADALLQNGTRLRMAELLAGHPALEGEGEPERLARIATHLGTTSLDADLREAVSTIVAFEACFRLALLGFQRLVWIVDHAPGQVTLGTLAEDAVVGTLLADIPAAAVTLRACLDGGTTDAFRRDLHRMTDTMSFLTRLADATDAHHLVRELLARHRDVQHGKLDRGRRKMPWLEVLDGGVVRPTLSSALEIPREPMMAADIAPHAYRTGTADALFAASRLCVRNGVAA